VKEQDRNKAWGFTLFGDDLRLEVGGKMSLMGLYQADLFFPSNITFPVTVPKFCMLIMYYETRDAITDDITFKITFGPENATLIEFLILRKELNDSRAEQIFPEDTTPEDKERIFHSRIPVGLSPFSISGLGRLRVRAHYSDGSILKLGSIAVRQVSVEEFNKMLATGPLPIAQQN
jgi:hypothetical protein